MIGFMARRRLRRLEESLAAWEAQLPANAVAIRKGLSDVRSHMDELGQRYWVQDFELEEVEERANGLASLAGELAPFLRRVEALGETAARLRDRAARCDAAPRVNEALQGILTELSRLGLTTISSREGLDRARAKLEDLERRLGGDHATDPASPLSFLQALTSLEAGMQAIRARRLGSLAEEQLLESELHDLDAGVAERRPDARAAADRVDGRLRNLESNRVVAAPDGATAEDRRRVDVVLRDGEEWAILARDQALRHDAAKALQGLREDRRLPSEELIERLTRSRDEAIARIEGERKRVLEDVAGVREMLPEAVKAVDLDAVSTPVGADTPSAVAKEREERLGEFERVLESAVATRGEELRSRLVKDSEQREEALKELPGEGLPLALADRRWGLGERLKQMADVRGDVLAVRKSRELRREVERLRQDYASWDGQVRARAEAVQARIARLQAASEALGGDPGGLPRIRPLDQLPPDDREPELDEAERGATTWESQWMPRLAEAAAHHQARVARIAAALDLLGLPLAPLGAEPSAWATTFPDRLTLLERQLSLAESLGGSLLVRGEAVMELAKRVEERASRISRASLTPEEAAQLEGLAFPSQTSSGVATTPDDLAAICERARETMALLDRYEHLERELAARARRLLDDLRTVSRADLPEVIHPYLARASALAHGLSAAPSSWDRRSRERQADEAERLVRDLRHALGVARGEESA